MYVRAKNIESPITISLPHAVLTIMRISLFARCVLHLDRIAFRETCLQTSNSLKLPNSRLSLLLYYSTIHCVIQLKLSIFEKKTGINSHLRFAYI